MNIVVLFFTIVASIHSCPEYLFERREDRVIYKYDTYTDDVKIYTYEDQYNDITYCRCFEYCNFNYMYSSDGCGGFRVIDINTTHYNCTFVIGTETDPPNYCSQENKGVRLYDKQGACNLLPGTVPPSEYTFNASYFRISPSLPPPPGDIVSAPSAPDTSTILDTFLKPEILVPFIIGSTISLIILVYIFRLCTNERADAFSLVFRTILGRKSNRVVIDTSTEVSKNNSVRK